MQVLILAPHNDDEALFNAFTMIRLKPLIICCSLSKRQGENALERLRESYEACKVAGCPVISTGIWDSELNEQNLEDVLKHFIREDQIVYAPALEGGHPDHDTVHKVAKKLFKNVRYYKTYNKVGDKCIKTISPTFEAGDTVVKQKMLNCYKSQIKRPSTESFFLNTDKEYYE